MAFTGHGGGRTDLYSSKLRAQWRDILNVFEYFPYPELFTTRLTENGDTALHLAAFHGETEIVAEMPDLMIKKNIDHERCLSALSAKNKRGETPLHYAASRGSLRMCESILRDESFYRLVHIRNNHQETPLFLAAFHGHKETFLFLRSVSIRSPRPDGSIPWRGNGGDTILHCTLQREHFDLAFQIIHLYKDEHIAVAVNENGMTPLHVLASKPSAFKSGTQFQWWTKLIYCCTIVKPLQKIDMTPTTTEFRYVDINTSEDNKSRTLVDEHINLPQNCRTCHKLFELLRNVINILFKHVFGLSGFVAGVGRIKEKHVWCSQIMDELVDQRCWQKNYPDVEVEVEVEAISSQQNQQYADGTTSSTKNDQEREMESMTVLLTATKNGVTEMVEKILNEDPATIHDRTSKDKNILVVAVENRQPRVILRLRNRDVWGSMVQTVDNKGNNVLHLAAEVPAHDKPWQIPGSAMQMQWEIKWYKFMKETAPSHLIFQTNDEGYTPGEIFIQKHKKIVKESSTWLTNTQKLALVWLYSLLALHMPHLPVYLVAPMRSLVNRTCKDNLHSACLQSPHCLHFVSLSMHLSCSLPYSHQDINQKILVQEHCHSSF